MELVDAAVHGWPAATWHTKCDSDTSYKAVLDYALTSERVANVRVGAAGHNLFDIALAWLLAKARGATAGLDVEMLLGMASAQAEVVKRTVGSLLLYTPVVHPGEFDVAQPFVLIGTKLGGRQPFGPREHVAKLRIAPSIAILLQQVHLFTGTYGHERLPVQFNSVQRIPVTAAIVHI